MTRMASALVLGIVLAASLVAAHAQLRQPPRSEIAGRYAALGGEKSFLGRPTMDEQPTPDGVGRFRHFERGSIYWHPQTGAHVVQGLIRQRWAELGWERSFLGYPTSDELPLANGAGRYSEFQGGTIYWQSGSPTVVVRKRGEPPPDFAGGTPPTNRLTLPQRGAVTTGRGAASTVAAGAPLVVPPPVDPGSLGRGLASGSLNGVPWSKYPSCSGSGIPEPVQEVLNLLSQIAGALGADVSPPDYRCGNYAREITAGVTLGPPPPNPNPRWGMLGGRGELMADAMLCLLKDIGDRPGGRLETFAPVPVGIGKVELRQIVGLSKFDPAAKRADLYQITKICAPLLGCIDAGRQNIVVAVRASEPAFPGGMRAGDYPIRNAYGLEVQADWSATQFGATLPPITIVTPYGQVSAKPGFTYSASLLPIDTPFAYPQSARVEFHHPEAAGVQTPSVEETYGRSGVQLIINIATNLPKSGKQPPQGWSSQLGFGGRDGAFDAQVWKGGGGVPPFRPDFNFGIARSPLESRPAANFVAEAPIRFEPPNPISLLPSAVQSIVSSAHMYVEVNPRFGADYAAQFGLLSREGATMSGCKSGKEFPGPCGVAESAVALQATANGRIDIVGTVHLKISFVSLGFYTPASIDVTKSFTVPVENFDRAWSPPRINNIQEAHASTHVGWAMDVSVAPGAPAWQGMKGLSGASASNLAAWTAACLASPPKNPAPPPPPSYEPGNANDLTPKLLPCNLCVADSTEKAFKPFKIFEVLARRPGLPESVCEWQQNTGCHDMCSWNGKSWVRVEQAAVNVVGKECGLKKPVVPR